MCLWCVCCHIYLCSNARINVWKLCFQPWNNFLQSVSYVFYRSSRSFGVAKLLSGFFQRKMSHSWKLKAVFTFDPLNWWWKTLVRSFSPWFFSDLCSWWAEAENHIIVLLSSQESILIHREKGLCKQPYGPLQIYSIHKGWVDHTSNNVSCTVVLLCSEDLFPSIHAHLFVVYDLNGCMTCSKSNLYWKIGYKWLLSFGTKKFSRIKKKKKMHCRENEGVLSKNTDKDPTYFVLLPLASVPTSTD